MVLVFWDAYWYNIQTCSFGHTFGKWNRIPQVVCCESFIIFLIIYKYSIINNSSSLSEILLNSSPFSATIWVCDSDSVPLSDGVIVTIGVHSRGCHTLGEADGGIVGVGQLDGQVGVGGANVRDVSSDATHIG